MKRLAAYILLLTSLLAACTNADKTAGKDNELEKIAIRPFSDSLQADTFKVKLLGAEPQKMMLVFTITAYDGQQIYKEDIKATDLFKNYDAAIDLNKKKNQLKFLKDEIDRFFDEDNFMEPAITDQETPDQYVPDKAFYDELKKSQLNGFVYRLGKENKLYIGWSAKEKKVKIYYSCCK